MQAGAPATRGRPFKVLRVRQLAGRTVRQVNTPWVVVAAAVVDTPVDTPVVVAEPGQRTPELMIHCWREVPRVPVLMLPGKRQLREAGRVPTLRRPWRATVHCAAGVVSSKPLVVESDAQAAGKFTTQTPAEVVAAAVEVTAEALEAEEIVAADALEATALDEDAAAEALDAEEAVAAEALEAAEVTADALEAEAVEADLAEDVEAVFWVTGPTLVPEAELTLEAETLDADTLEAETLDADTLEAEALDADALEAETLDADALEAEALDADTLEAETLDAETLDAETVDAEALEAEAVEAEALEADETVAADALEAMAADVEVTAGVQAENGRAWTCTRVQAVFAKVGKPA